MADQSHVEAALLDAVTAALYPYGTDAPPAIAAPCRTHRGWPLPAALNADLARGIVTISVSVVDSSQRITTRYPDQWASTGAVEPALIASVVADQVRFSGAASPGQLAGILADGYAAVHRTKNSDTPSQIAADLAQQLRTRRIVHYADTALIIPGVRDLRARVVADQPAMRELRRQTQQFRIACLCPTPALRDAAASTIDTALAAIRFLPLPDGTFAHLAQDNTVTLDDAEQALLYRRDLLLRAEYATTQTAGLPALIFGAGHLNAAPFIG